MTKGINIWKEKKKAILDEVSVVKGGMESISFWPPNLEKTVCCSAVHTGWGEGIDVFKLKFKFFNFLNRITLSTLMSLSKVSDVFCLHFSLDYVTSLYKWIVEMMGPRACQNRHASSWHDTNLIMHVFVSDLNFQYPGLLKPIPYVLSGEFAIKALQQIFLQWHWRILATQDGVLVHSCW